MCVYEIWRKHEKLELLSVLLKYTVVALLLFQTSVSYAQTEATCNVKQLWVPDKGDTLKYGGYLDALIFSPVKSTKEKLILSSICKIRVSSPQHMFRYFICKGSIGDDKVSTLWYRSSNDYYNYWDSYQKNNKKSWSKLPKYSVLKGKLLLPISVITQDGWQKQYPATYEDAYDYYPKNFIKISPIYTRANQLFETKLQTLTYKTMKGYLRSAVTGSLKVDCFEIYFISWQPDELTERQEKIMENMFMNFYLANTSDVIRHLRNK